MRPLVALAVLVVGCGGITAEHADAGLELELEGGSSDVVDGAPRLPTQSPDADAMQDHPSVRDAAPEESPSCSSACAACSSPSARADAGPEYSSPSTCEAVVACVRADAGRASQLLGCHNVNGGEAEWGGYFCVRDLLAAGCR